MPSLRRPSLLLLAVIPALTSGSTKAERGDIPDLPHATVIVNSARHELVIELPPTDVAAMGMVRLPVYQTHIPLSGAIRKYHVEVLDSAGRELPKTLLHHFNLTDPDRRELFLPTALHVLAASKETPTATVPWLLFGMPFERGQRMITSAMLGNETAALYRGARVRLVLRYVPSGRPWPLYRVYPWVMDVRFPLGRQPGGSKAFDLQPGRTVHSWEASPAIRGTILGLGGHLHDYGVRLELTNVTTGEVMWHVEPVTDSLGRVLSVPLTRLYRWNRLGVRVVPEHRYRLTAVYQNPTGRVLRDGGMAAIAGVFVPDQGERWPAVDTQDSIYRQDLHDTLRDAGRDGPMMMHPAPTASHHPSPSDSLRMPRPARPVR